MGQASTIATAVGGRITPPKMKIPTPLPAVPLSPDFTGHLAKVITDRWDCGGNFFHLADAVMDAVCHHIRTADLAQLDKRLTDAIEDHMSVDQAEGDADQAAECSVEDIEAVHARKFAAHSLRIAQRNPAMFTPAEAAAMVGAMLNRPDETDRYLALRDLNHSPAEALAIVLAERRRGDGIAPDFAKSWGGGALAFVALVTVLAFSGCGGARQARTLDAWRADHPYAKPYTASQAPAGALSVYEFSDRVPRIEMQGVEGWYWSIVEPRIYSVAVNDAGVVVGECYRGGQP